jgi:hypothetical protein
MLGGRVVRAVAGEKANLWWNHLFQANAERTFLYGLTLILSPAQKPEHDRMLS